MAIKKRISHDNLTIETLANELADKPYGEEKQNDTVMRTTITLPASVLFALEDLAKNNKRKSLGLKSVSALIRDSIQKTFKL